MSIGIVGCDPGVHGAFSLILDGKLKAIYDMPVIETIGKKKLSYDEDGMPIETTGKRHEIDPQGVRRLFANWRDVTGAPLILVCEKVWSRPKQNVANMDKLIYGTGLIMGVAIGIGFGVRQVAPATWKAALAVSAQKCTSLDLARKLVEDEDDTVKWIGMFKRKMDNDRAESYLLAKFGCREINSDE